MYNIIRDSDDKVLASRDTLQEAATYKREAGVACTVALNLEAMGII